MGKTNSVRMWGMCDTERGEVLINSLREVRSHAVGYRRGYGPPKGKLPVLPVTLSYEVPAQPAKGKKGGAGR